jgi:hypothetical protein
MALKSFPLLLHHLITLLLCHYVVAAVNDPMLLDYEDATSLSRQSSRRLQTQPTPPTPHTPPTPPTPLTPPTPPTPSPPPPDPLLALMQAVRMYMDIGHISCGKFWEDLDTNKNDLGEQAEIEKFIKEKLNPWRKEHGLAPLPESLCNPKPKRALQESQCTLPQSCPLNSASPTPAPIREPSGGVIGGKKQ